MSTDIYEQSDGLLHINRYGGPNGSIVHQITIIDKETGKHSYVDISVNDLHNLYKSLIDYFY